MPNPAPKNRRVRDLVPDDEKEPLASEVQRFVTYYVNCRETKLAAVRAYMMPEMGDRLYRNPRIRAMIDKRIALIELEEAKLTAKANLLTADLLDSALVEEVKSKKNGHIRVRAIELGYRRRGMIRDGEFVGVTTAAGTAVAKTYGQITTTMRRTTTEEVVQSSELPPPPAKVEPLVLEY